MLYLQVLVNHCWGLGVAEKCDLHSREALQGEMLSVTQPVCKQMCVNEKDTLQLSAQTGF